MKLTKAQERTLKIALEESEIVFGGLDQTRNVRIDVVFRLYESGFLRYAAPSTFFEKYRFLITEKGREYLNERSTSEKGTV